MRARGWNADREIADAQSSRSTSSEACLRGERSLDRAVTPSGHRRYAEWKPARIARKAERIGSATAGLSTAIMRAKPHPEQGFRAPARCITVPQGAFEGTTEANYLKLKLVR